MFVPLCLSLLSYASAANILVVLPLPVYSHVVSFTPLLKGLASRGHNLTVVSPFPQKEPVPNLHDIEIINIRPSMAKKMEANNVFKTFTSNRNMYSIFVKYFEVMSLFAELALEDETVQTFLKDTNSKYDLVMTETFFACEAFIALGQKYNAPIINLHSAGVLPSLAYWTGNNFPTAYVPNLFLPYTNKMTFFQRATNSLRYSWEIVVNYLYFHEKRDALMRKYMVWPGSENLPPLDEMLRNTSLTLIDSHLSIRHPIPFHSNIIDISGMALKDPKPLPADLKNIMDEAKDGVVFFTLGSHLTISSLKPEQQAAIFGALSKVKHTVLMKWELDEIPNKPANIHFRKWLPQPDILAHKNCRIFISHGGIHGVTEGIHNGVPILGLPLMADQSHNIKLVESVGMGMGLDIRTLKEPEFLNAINELLYNPSYKANAMKRCAIMRDRPMKPLDRAVYWVEYVLRHKGAPHLRPSVLDMPVYQYFLLDVIAFFFIIALVVIIVFYAMFKLFFKFVKYLCCKKVNKSKKD